jgi:uncharacterized protein YqjF (DUF2071 family)
LASVSIEVEDFALITYRVQADRVRDRLPHAYELQVHEEAGEELTFITTTCFKNRNFRPTMPGYPRHSFFESTYRTYISHRGEPAVYFFGRYMGTRLSYLGQRAAARHTFYSDFDVSIDKDDRGYAAYRCTADGPKGTTSFSLLATAPPSAKDPFGSGQELAQFLTFRPVGCFTSTGGLQLSARVEHAHLTPWSGELVDARLDLWEELEILSRAEASDPYSVLVTTGTRFLLHPPRPV